MKLATAIRNSRKLPMSEVEAFGREAQPLSNYVNASQQVGSEFMIKAGGKKRRVYSWVEAEASATYVIIDGFRVFLTDEVDAMLTYAPIAYGVMVPVAQEVKVAA